MARPKAKSAEAPPEAVSAEVSNYVRRRLAVLDDVFAAAAVGDFTKTVQLPKTDDEFTELFVGVQMMLDVIHEKVDELLKVNRDLEAAVAQRTEQLNQQKKALESSEAYVNQLINAAPDAIIVVDDKGKIVRVNRQTEVLFKYKSDQLLGKAVEALIPQRFHGVHVGHRADYMADPHTRPMGIGRELFARRSNGSEFPVEISLSPVDQDGKKSVIAIVRDISQRKTVEQQLKERADELQKFNQLMVGRELRMIELKDQLKAQKKRGGEP